MSAFLHGLGGKTPTDAIASSTAAFNGVKIKGKYVFPTTVEENTMQPSITISKDALYDLLGFEEIEVPEYFTSVTLSGGTTNTNGDLQGSSRLKSLIISAENLYFSGTYANSLIRGLARLEYLGLPNITGTNDALDVFCDSSARQYKGTGLTISAPKLTAWNMHQFGYASNYVHISSVNMPLVTVFGGTSTSWEVTRFVTGTIKLPACSDMKYFRCPESTEGLTFKLPSLTQFSTSQAFNYGGPGTLHVYLGPDVSIVSCSANFITYAAYLDVHIPTGDSTTKTTLDALGIVYTQDYNYQEDLV